MPHPLSNDMRLRMVKAVSAGASCNATARRFDVAASTVIKLMQAYRETGSHASRRIGGYKKHRLAAHAGIVADLVVATPDATLDELVATLRSMKIRVGRSSLDRYLRHTGLSFKKNSARQRTGPA